MLSVTARIDTISQPYGGYVPKKLFNKKCYKDGCELSSINSAYASIQGLTVDYLTRFMLSKNKYLAFFIPILGAKAIDEVNENDIEYKNIMLLLDKVTGLDDVSIYNSCQIVGYDTAYRAGVEKYSDVNEIYPTSELISNIRIMVNRSLYFLDDVGPVLLDGFTFENGYTKLVSSGDGDYLTNDMLIDFKVSINEFNTKWSLQLLMYYLMGIHSIHNEFKFIKYLCIYNPLKNISYVVNIMDIEDKIKYIVSNEVIGYKMKYKDYSTWRKVQGTDYDVLAKFIENNINTNFNIIDYKDGIHYISINDYWTYLRSIDDSYKNTLRPIFKNIVCIVMVKHNGYVMFLSLSYNGTLNILNGGARRKATYELEYYYDNIERYCISIVSKLHKYWDALYDISDKLQSLKPEKKFLRKNVYSKYIRDQKFNHEIILKFDDWYELYGKHIKLNGKVHGCIVDIDYFNHIYLNPYDAKLTAYYAISMYDKDVYNNTLSLISEQRPEMLESFKDLLNTNSTSNTYELISNKDIISNKKTKVYSHEMYMISNRLKPLQKIYDIKLVQVWYDDVLTNDVNLLDSILLLQDNEKDS